MAIIRYFRKHEARVFGQQQTGVLRSKKIGSSLLLKAKKEKQDAGSARHYGS